MRNIFLIFFLSLIACNSEKPVDKTVFELSKKYGEGVFSNIYMDSIIYTEKASLNGEYIMYNEAKGYIFSKGNNSRIPLDNFCFLFTSFGKSFRNGKWLELLKHKYLETTISKQTDIAPGYNDALNSFRRFELFGPLNTDHFDDYHYDFVSEGSKNKGLEFVSKIDTGIHGVILYNNYNVISEIILKNFTYFSTVFHSLKTANLKISFDLYKGNYVLSTVCIDFKDGELQHLVSLSLMGKPLSNFQLSKKEWNILQRNDYSPFVEYIPNSRDSLIDDNRIRIDLEKNSVSLENQFINNSGKFYYESYDEDGRKFKHINENEIDKIIEKLKL